MMKRPIICSLFAALIASAAYGQSQAEPYDITIRNEKGTRLTATEDSNNHLALRNLFIQAIQDFALHLPWGTNQATPCGASQVWFDSTTDGAWKFMFCQDDGAGSTEWVTAGLMLLAESVDAPADEECLTWETTGGLFEWQTCGGGGGSLTVEEVDGTPSITATTIKFDQADGLTVTDLGSGVAQIDSTGGGGGTPAGADTEIQYNNAGAFGASSEFRFFAGTPSVVIGDTGTGPWVTIEDDLIAMTVSTGPTVRGPGLIGESASATNPTLLTNNVDQDTGIGESANGGVTLIDESTEIASFDTTEISFPSLVSCDTIDTDADGVLSCGTDGGAGIGTDDVGTVELDDDANTPTAGEFVVVETGAASFDYLTPDAGTDVTADLEEEAHAAEHAENAADEILAEDLGTACTDGQVIEANATGGLVCAAAGGGGAGFDAITTGTNTSATMTVGTGASIVASGTGAITATGVVVDSVALGTDTTGDYVSSATASQGLTVTGTEGASVGVQDCAANEILKRNAGDTAWECAADSTGGTPSFDAVTSGTNTSAAMVVGSGASLRSTAGILGIPNSATLPGTCTVGDIYQDNDATSGAQMYLCESTDTWVAQGGGGGGSGDNAPYGEYDPDNPPATCAHCEEFTGDTESLTWRWGNQQSATLDLEFDHAVLLTPTTSGQQNIYRWTTISDPTSDFTVSMKCKSDDETSAAHKCVLAILVSGDETTPTSMWEIDRNSTSTIERHERSSYTAAASNNQSLNSAVQWGVADMEPLYLQWRYDSTAQEIAPFASSDGIWWLLTSSPVSLGADPTASVGYGISGSSKAPDAYVDWFRVRTDAAGLAGEVSD